MPDGDAPLHVLVVDDDTAVLRMLALALRRRGLAVLSARTGAEAVQMYRSCGGAFSVVLLDVIMPPPDGPQTFAALRQIDPHVRCCFMSGSIGDYSGEQLLAMG